MGNTAPRSMPELLSDIEREWKALMGVVQRLTPQQMLKPDAGGWSPKDNLAHLAAWLHALLEYHMDGHPIEAVLDLPRGREESWDDNAVNAVLFERNRSRTTEDVVKELNRAYMQTTARLRISRFDDLLKLGWPESQAKSVLDYVLGNTTEHFAEHRATIEKAL